MVEEEFIMGKYLKSIREEFDKLWLAMMVKNTVDETSRRIISSSSRELISVLGPFKKSMEALWMEIIQDEIDTAAAREKFSEIIEKSNEDLKGKYKIIAPEDLFKRFED